MNNGEIFKDRIFYVKSGVDTWVGGGGKNGKWGVRDFEKMRKS